MKRQLRLSRSIYKKLKPIDILHKKHSSKQSDIVEPKKIADPNKVDALPIINKSRTTCSRRYNSKMKKKLGVEEYNISKKIEYKKIVIYTSMYGNYDKLKDQPKFENAEYVCFTDNKQLVHPSWKMISNNEILTNKPNVYRAKYFKMMSHILFPDADYTIYLDASIQIRHDNFIQVLLNYLGEHDYGIYIHPKRSCIYQEHKRLLKMKSLKMKRIMPLINKQLDAYRSEGMPQNYGLWACGILIRKNTKHNTLVNELWWEQVLKWSYRDQISLPYILWKNNLKIDTINLNQYSDQLFKIHVHNSNGWIRNGRTI